MEYEYYNRGKCGTCGTVMWITENPSNVECICFNALLCPDNVNNENIVAITDNEFTSSLRVEYGIETTRPIILIEL